MKRQLFPPIAVLLVLVLFAPFSASFNVRAQGGDARLTPEPKSAPKGGKGAKPTPTATPAPPPMARNLTYGEELKGRLDPRASEKGAAGVVFEDLILNAKSEDLLTLKIESENSSFGLQILDKDKTEVAIAKDAAGNYIIKTQTGGLPSDG